MIQDVKDTISSALILGGISKVYTYLPERPIPPCAMIEPDVEFIRTNETAYGVFHTTNWKIRVMVPRGANDKETNELDSYLDDLLPALWDQTDCNLLSVDKPFITEANNASYLTTFINISIDMQGGN
ncbi:MAG: hypothetical protein EBR38_08365 [Flavobacteriaceae bacterium]|nr:hypothetical protein [Flavobacteriaceae bacterium]